MQKHDGWCSASSINTSKEKSKPDGIFCSATEQGLGGSRDDPGRLVGDDLGQGEVMAADGISYGREICLVIARPQLWPKNNMAELRSVGNLCLVST